VSGSVGCVLELEAVGVDDGLGEGLRSFLREVVADAAFDDPEGIFAGEFFAIAGVVLCVWRRSESGWKLRSELFVSLACSDADACESYRKRYGAVTPNPEQK
jgi:hypothetical protein